MREATAATGNPEYAAIEAKMADFLIRIQTRCHSNPQLDGMWYRSFDFDRWDYWGSDGDLGWGAFDGGNRLDTKLDRRDPRPP